MKDSLGRIMDSRFSLKIDEKGKQISVAELEQRTAEFEFVLTTLSRGDGIMKNDIEFLAKSYGIKIPYWEIGE